MAVLLIILPAVFPLLLSGQVRPEGGRERRLYPAVPAGPEEFSHPVYSRAVAGAGGCAKVGQVHHWSGKLKFCW